MTRGWLVGLHLIGVVLWMGGLLAFSRILGYQSKELPSVRPRLTFIESRLNWLVAVPGALLTIVFGVWLAWQHGEAWFRVSLWMGTCSRRSTACPRIRSGRCGCAAG